MDKMEQNPPQPGFTAAPPYTPYPQPQPPPPPAQPSMHTYKQSVRSN